MSREEYRHELMQIFVSYTNWNKRVKSSVLKLGIDVVREGKHIILGINGKSVPISCTGSDKRRGGRNIITKIMKAKYSSCQGK